MPVKHVLIYGYKPFHVGEIEEELIALLKTKIDFISACGHEDETVGDIIHAEYNDVFEEHEVKIVMFVDLTDDEIDRAINGFPKEKDIERPIFCTMTKANVEWTFEELMDDLLEEEKHFEEQKKKEKGKKGKK